MLNSNYHNKRKQEEFNQKYSRHPSDFISTEQQAQLSQFFICIQNLTPFSQEIVKQLYQIGC